MISQVGLGNYYNSQNIVSAPQQRKIQPQGHDVVEFTGRQHTQPQIEEQKSSSKKGIIAALGLAALAVGTFILTRGRSTNKAEKLLKQIPEDLQVRFGKLKDLQGEEFVKKAYSEMVEYMGLKGIAPKTIKNSGADSALSITGGYNPIENTIGYTDGFFNILPKEEQIGMLTHELQHCKQFTNMLRTEGITVEKYVEAHVNSTINELIEDPLKNFAFHMAYNIAKERGAEKEFIQRAKDNWSKALIKRVNENYQDILAMPKIKADSPEGIKAFEHLKASGEYEGLDFMGLGSKEYKNNPLEVEAYAMGDKMKDLFQKYMGATSLMA